MTKDSGQLETQQRLSSMHGYLVLVMRRSDLLQAELQQMDVELKRLSSLLSQHLLDLNKTPPVQLDLEDWLASTEGTSPSSQNTSHSPATYREESLV